MRRGGDHRGSSRDRRRRKLWLLSAAAGFGGNGSSVACHWCGRLLVYETLEADRRIPGACGGTYARANLVPACRGDNARRGNELRWGSTRHQDGAAL